ncbi:hypothetical protein LLG35_20380 [Klebsiella pneumoniae]|uniref:hypothetical protein n=1 Tax=Klebsiella pneumoniae TaxID=573 RepID=UPI001EE7DFE7|nr:hypothetical protein [Klebsiella pneumoniae]MCG5574300.1 hypothetical protein [Klebsiella pneumoniae]
MTDITELAHGKSLRKKLNRRLNDAYGFQRTSGGKHTTISLSIDECKSIIAAMDERLALVEALEKAKGMEAYWKTQCRGITDHCEELQARIAGLEREQEQLRPVGVMSEQAFHRLENSECRFIALWPRPGIFLPRKRPEDGVLVYARTAAAAGIKVEAE